MTTPDKLLIAFRGENNIFELDLFAKWAEDKGYDWMLFSSYEVENAKTIIHNTPYSNVDVLGFSRGAVSAFELVKKTPLQLFGKLFTVGTAVKVNEFFDKMVPNLKNLEKHYNFVEEFQQPPNFLDNPNNISLGKVSHFDSLGAAIAILDHEQW